MRKATWCIVVLFICLSSQAQVSGSFVVKGDINTYYPVLFTDGGWSNNVATEMTIGRSSVHTDASWRGSCIYKFRFHTTNWGHLSNFIDADLRETTNAYTIINDFVGGWTDCSVNNGSEQIAIWLRGGTTTYYYNSNYGVSPVVYDGVQNAVPYTMSGGLILSTKSSPDSYVDIMGINTANDIKAGGVISSLATTGVNYFGSSVGVGTTNVNNYALAVNGSAIFTAAWVKPYANWPDYVFGTDYQLPSLDSVSTYIQKYRHLPDIPSADSIQSKGVDLGGTQAALLKKIEELTLYVIDQNKKMEAQDKKIKELEEMIKSKR